ncbi:MAG TPA: ribonuclease T [Leucothrix mucor]|uniref:Ribonuclease T n=1 Tax=Leucothrix mucor TaxID=45248 RepID=A0A7V2WVL0_LEUMU|nr:ribonuclease T [Leucothrix mucor]
MTKSEQKDITPIAQRFRGFLPVVIDLETGGFNHQTDALLEVAASFLRIDEAGMLSRVKTVNWHLTPFEGSNLDPKSLEVNGIDPDLPFRQAIAVDERIAINALFKAVRAEIKLNKCTRAVLVGHNASFDLNFLNAAVARLSQKRNPFHPFSTFDTVSLAALAYGQTVLARSVQAAGFPWDSAEAHSAVYDTEKTADLFCQIMNDWQGFRPFVGK